jgi:hypothetical protein
VRDLSKKKLGQFSNALEAAQDAFRSKIDKLAEHARSEILPYFKKHGFDFMAGNGTWLISRIDEESYEVSVDDGALPVNIRELLTLEVAHADHLGFYIRDIKRGEW